MAETFWASSALLESFPSESGNIKQMFEGTGNFAHSWGKPSPSFYMSNVLGVQNSTCPRLWLFTRIIFLFSDDHFTSCDSHTFLSGGIGAWFHLATGYVKKADYVRQQAGFAATGVKWLQGLQSSCRSSVKSCPAMLFAKKQVILHVYYNSVGLLKRIYEVPRLW